MHPLLPLMLKILPLLLKILSHNIITHTYDPLIIWSQCNSCILNNNTICVSRSTHN